MGGDGGDGGRGGVPFAGGGGPEPSPASTRPRNRLREAATSRGRPRARSSARWATSARSCSACLAKPRPGSRTIRSGAMPPATTASTRAWSSATTSATTSAYTARLFMSWLKPRQCMTTKGASVAATTGIMFGSARPPLTSLTSNAPAATACSATRARMVSTETVTPSEARPRTTGTTRRSSSSSSTREAPGRVDSPPTSTRSAPSVTRSRPRLTAAAVSNQRPPSEKESGVTLTTPMTAQRSHSGSPVTVPRRRNVLIRPA